MIFLLRSSVSSRLCVAWLDAVICRINSVGFFFFCFCVGRDCYYDCPGIIISEIIQAVAENNFKDDTGEWQSSYSIKDLKGSFNNQQSVSSYFLQQCDFWDWIRIMETTMS